NVTVAPATAVVTPPDVWVTVAVTVWLPPTGFVAVGGERVMPDVMEIPAPEMSRYGAPDTRAPEAESMSLAVYTSGTVGSVARARGTQSPGHLSMNSCTEHSQPDRSASVRAPGRPGKLATSAMLPAQGAPPCVNCPGPKVLRPSIRGRGVPGGELVQLKST